MTKDLSDRVTSYNDVLVPKCDLRNDEFGRVVKFRLVSVLSDLLVEDSRYHRACNRNIHKNITQKSNDPEVK